MGLTFTIGFNRAAERYIGTGHAKTDVAVRDLLRDAFYGSYAIFEPISSFNELTPSKKYTRFAVTLNDKLSDAIRREVKKPDAVLQEVIGSYLRNSCKVWDQEGYKFTPPVLC